MEQQKLSLITIDGPVASGKSTAAQMLANHLGWIHLSTGLLFRAVGYILTHSCGYSLEDLKEPKVEDLCDCLDGQNFLYIYDKHARILFKGQDITGQLKTKEMDIAASRVAVNQLVRKQLLLFTRNFVQGKKVVVEGRDIGSVVFPDALVKFYITASVQERGRRWQQYQAATGKTYTLEESMKAISDRDHRDQTREHSPLVIPQGAYVLDNSALNKEETLSKMLDVISAAQKRL
jgi:CMP/dCMP kinase